MNISRINCNPINFKAVEKSAAKKAIERANGDVEELKKIKKLVAEQKNNTEWDIKASNQVKPFNFYLHKRGERTGKLFIDFNDACSYATHLKNASDSKQCKDKKEYAEKLSSDILDNCIEDQQ